MLNIPSGKDRRTLKKIDYYPTPQELYNRVVDPATDWPYRSEQKDRLLTRDKALCAVLYNAELRISEARRLVKEQFIKKKGVSYYQEVAKGKLKYCLLRITFLPGEAL